MPRRDMPLRGTYMGRLGGRAGCHRRLPLDRLRSLNAQQDAAAILDEILGEADALIRQRLKEHGLELPHLVVGATPDNQIVLRSNGDADVLRSFGEDLKNVADELTSPDDTTH